MRRTLAALALLAVAGCGADPGEQPTSRQADRSEAPTPRVIEPLRAFPDYEPGAAEDFPNAKRIAGRAAQRLLTYREGALRQEIAARLELPPAETERLGETIAPAIEPAMQSSAEVIYAQMAGTTPTTFGAMVVVRQHLQDAEGRRRSVTRTVDVRLRRSGGPWSVAEVASVGGTPVRRPAALSDAARRVLDDDNITLTDTARWDIYRGDVDRGLLAALAKIAQRHRISVAVVNTGHPHNVWETDRRSAHSRGYAADIYSVDGRLVIRQRNASSGPAYELARRLVAGGARQVGSPWDFDGGGRSSFTDVVHQDHIHLQQTAAPDADDEA